jgi:hypothetical protein
MRVGDCERARPKKIERLCARGVLNCIFPSRFVKISGCGPPSRLQSSEILERAVFRRENELCETYHPTGRS